jgi:hypothetical protein
MLRKRAGARFPEAIHSQPPLVAVYSTDCAGRGKTSSIAFLIRRLETMSEQLKPVSQRMDEELPAPWVNRCYVLSGPIVRITFAEIVPGGSGKEYARASVTMSPATAVELAEIILNQSTAHPVKTAKPPPPKGH